jgi:hypothetical protein
MRPVGIPVKKKDTITKKNNLKYYLEKPRVKGK